MSWKFYQKFKSDLKLYGISSTHFNKSCWETIKVNGDEKETHVSWAYLTYRGFFLAYFLMALSSSIGRDPNLHIWPIWATNLSLLNQAIYGSTSFGNLLFRFIKSRRRLKNKKEKEIDAEGQEMTSLSINASLPNESKLEGNSNLNVMDSITWLFLNLTGTIPYIVTLGYWLFVYNPLIKRVSLGWNLTVHGFNSILALIDIFVINIPIRMAHAVYTFSFTLLYISFSFVYECVGGVYRDLDKPYIYVFLNWREKPLRALFYSSMALLASILLHLFLWLLFKLRLHVVYKFKNGACSH